MSSRRCNLPRRDFHFRRPQDVLQIDFEKSWGRLNVSCSILHCLKSVQMRRIFWSVFFPYSDWIRKFTQKISVFSPNTGKYRPEKIPYLDTFQAVLSIKVAVTEGVNLFWPTQVEDHLQISIPTRNYLPTK